MAAGRPAQCALVVVVNNDSAKGNSGLKGQSGMRTFVGRQCLTTRSPQPTLARAPRHYLSPARPSHLQSGPESTGYLHVYDFPPVLGTRRTALCVGISPAQEQHRSVTEIALLLLVQYLQVIVPTGPTVHRCFVNGGYRSAHSLYSQSIPIVNRKLRGMRIDFVGEVDSRQNSRTRGLPLSQRTAVRP